MNILVINAGSSSLKYQFINIDTQAVLAKGLCERIGIDGSKLTQKAPGKDEFVRQEHMGDHSDAIKMVIEALTDSELILTQLSAEGYASTQECEIALTTGAAGTVYLCHPFIVHAAQPHDGTEPRFMAQPPLVPSMEFDPKLAPSPVQVAIRKACRLTI